MIRYFIVFLILWVFLLGMFNVFRDATNRQRWGLTKMAVKAALIAGVAVGLLSLIVFVF